jgi:hypothetical protein
MRQLAAAVAVGLAAAILTSCGDSGGGAGPGDTTPPTIVSVSPADGADDVGLIEPVGITFSEPMDASTINDETITVSGRRGGFVEYDEETRTASVIPDTLYPAEGEQTVTVTDGVSDEAGNALAAASATTFETGVLDCEHLLDYLEPNDEAAAAASVEMDRAYQTLAVCGDDTDFFVIDLAETTRIDFHITFRHAASQWSSLALMRNDTNEPYFTRGWPSTDQGEEKTVSFTFLPGTHRYRYGATIEPGEYILYDVELVTGEPCRDDAFEDNDWYWGPAPITEGTYGNLLSCPADGDYYAIDLEEGQTLTVTITRGGNPAEREMSIWLPDGTGITTAGTTENTIVMDWTATETGTHRISTRCWTDAEGYQMDVDVSD